MEIRRALPSSIEVIGVFVRPPFDFLRDVLQRVGLDAVQLYDADAEYLGKLDTGGVPLWLASGIATMDDVRKLKEMVRQCQALRHHVTAVLVDAKVAGQSGGTGQVVPWPLLEQVTWDLPCILAGGLTPENVGNAIRSVRPQGVDVASGVEIAPGKKDETKVRAFVENALTVADEVARESRSK